MGLDARLNVIYGYRIKGLKIYESIIENYKNKVITDSEYDQIYDNLLNGTNGLFYIEDQMQGNYEYIGLNLYSESSDYGEDNHVGFSLNNLKELCNDEKLDKLIQEQLPWIVDNLYDVCGLMEGELPKLWVVKNVW